MDAIMLALVALLLANADGRAGRFVAALTAQRGDATVPRAIVAFSFAANALIAAWAGTLFQRAVGPGIIALFLAVTLFGAAAAVVWRDKAERDAAALAALPAPLLLARVFAADFGNRSHCLIGALAASSGAGWWAAAGGAIGWGLALLFPFLPGMAPATARGRLLRWGAALLLALWGVVAAFHAFGIIEK